MTLEIPARVPWALHRIATSRRYTDSLHTIATEWSLVDLYDAHAVLDALEDAEAQALDDA